MTLAYLAFTDTGEELARRLAQALGGVPSRCNRPLSLRDWTAQNFPHADGLVFVGAAGIAVRAVAPYVVSKASDPAVVVVDECGRFAVPVLSGHLGGANDLARRIAAVCGAVPVITTATDSHGLFAVDEWSKRQNCTITNPHSIKLVSSAVLRGEPIPVYSLWDISGTPPQGLYRTQDPAGCRIRLDWRAPEDGDETLHLAPNIVVLGVGCRKNTPQEDIERSFAQLKAKTGLSERAVCAVSSIDLKKEEPGLIAFCRAHGWPFVTYSAQELLEVPGTFTASSFVRGVTGVDNVCERSAACCAGGTIIEPKNAGHGVTMALACKPYQPNWRWQDE